MGSLNSPAAYLARKKQAVWCHLKQGCCQLWGHLKQGYYQLWCYQCHRHGCCQQL